MNERKKERCKEVALFFNIGIKRRYADM